MKNFKRGEKGFTLVELLIVVAILGILAAVVIPNVVGLLGRGGKQAYETDANTVELGAAAFYSDIHTGWRDVVPADDKTLADPARSASFATNIWGDANAPTDPAILPGHYFPTAIAAEANHYLTLGNATDPDNVNNYLLVWSDAPTTQEATDADIQVHGIWMGLLVNPYNADDPLPVAGGTTNRWLVSPLQGEGELYLDEMPQSAITNPATINGDNDPSSVRSGGYAWIVGRDGQVYGAYNKTCDPTGTNFAQGTYWFAGFSGSYP